MWAGMAGKAICSTPCLYPEGGRGLLPFPRALALAAACQSAPAQSWSQGCLLQPAAAQGAAGSVGPLGARWWVGVGAWSAPGPAGAWFGLGSLTRSTGPALVVTNRGSQIASALPQQPPPVGSVVGPTGKEMGLYISFLTRRWW